MFQVSLKHSYFWAFPCLKDPPVLAHLPAEVLFLSSCLFPASPELTQSNSHSCQEVLGDFLFAFILFQGHGAELSYTHSCNSPRPGLRITLNAADPLNLHRLLKSSSHQLRILLHMLLKFSSKPLFFPGLFLPGLWRQIASRYPRNRQDIAKRVRVWHKSQAVLQCTWHLTPWIHSRFKSLHAGASGGILITLFFVEVFCFLPF